VKPARAFLDEVREGGGSLNKGWPARTLGEVARLVSGRHIAAKDYNSESRGVGYLTGPSDFGPINPIVSKWTEFPKAKAIRGDILITVKGSGVGKINRLDSDEAAIGRQLMAIRVHGADAGFVYAFLGSAFDRLQSEATGASIPGVSRAQVLGLRIPIPPRPEQQRIARILDQAFAGISAAGTNAAKSLRNARALFASHLQSVFTDRGQGWPETTLGEVCGFAGGSQPPKSVFKKRPSPDDIRLIQIRDYKSDKHPVHIPRSLARRFCQADDVMIGRYGPPLFQILRGLEGAYNVALMKAAPDESRLDRDFLFYFLKHPALFQHVIHQSERAAGQIGLTKGTLEPYPIALPSLAEQRSIINRIAELESGTRRLESICRRKLAALDALKKSLLRKAFSGEL
jgi:type I restriction enzyme, S subunit